MEPTSRQQQLSLRPGRTVSASAQARQVDMWSPDSCCTFTVAGRGAWDHTSNICRVGAAASPQVETPLRSNLEDQRAMGLGHRLCAGVWRALHELLCTRA